MLSSGIVAREEAPQVRNVPTVSTVTLAALGITERGPYEVTRVTSYEEFRKLYGQHRVSGFLSLVMQAFFDGGGADAYIKRVVHYTDIANEATKTSAKASANLQSAAAAPSAGSLLAAVGPYALTPGDTLVFSIDGGADDTATFDAAAASRTAGATGTYALSDGDTLTVAIDGGSVQTVTFLTSEFGTIGAATAAEVAAVINAKLVGAFADVDTNAVRITSDKKGTDSGVNVTGGTANAVLLFTTGNIAGTGDVADISAVTVSEIETVVEADVTGVTVTSDGGAARFTSNTTGASSSVQIVASSTADAKLGVDNAVHSGSSGAAVNCMSVSGKTDGTYANTISVEVAAATSGEADEFDLTVLQDGVVLEPTWRNLSVDSASPNYHVTVLNHATSGSDYISTAELVADLRPANGTYGPLTGGNDGLSSIADTDFIGNSASETGLRGFDKVQELSLMVCPDRTTAAAQVAMALYCQDTREGSIFPIFDPPAGQTYQQMLTYHVTTAGLYDLTEYGAVYWPRVKILNPNKAEFGNDALITVPPSGHIAGTFARTDTSRDGGVYQAPAGRTYGILNGVQALENDAPKDKAVRNVLYPKNINPINAAGSVFYLDGARTCKITGNFPSIPERRGVIFIKQSLLQALEFVRFRNHDEALRAEAARVCEAFLFIQMQQGAFRSKNPEQAFFVDVSAALNPPSVVFQNKLYVRVGLATQKPAEFITLLLSQDTRDLTAEITG